MGLQIYKVWGGQELLLQFCRFLGGNNSLELQITKKYFFGGGTEGYYCSLQGITELQIYRVLGANFREVTWVDKLQSFLGGKFWGSFD